MTMPKCNRYSPPSGPALSIASINIEGFSRHKADILATAVRCFDIVCMQETHFGPAQHRPAIPGMKLVAEIRHRQYGSAVFSRPNLAIEEVCTHITKGQMETITVALSNVSSHQCINPPKVRSSTLNCQIDAKGNATSASGTSMTIAHCGVMK